MPIKTFNNNNIIIIIINFLNTSKTSYKVLHKDIKTRDYIIKSRIDDVVKQSR